MNHQECQYHLTSGNRCATVQQQLVEQEATISGEHRNSDQLSNDEDENQNWYSNNNASLPDTPATSVETSSQRTALSINF